ncbi:MAG: GNAT family N-acetyltransferase [Clostridia bacterium]|nr:GNAT family N-acetyltransferase [Clostridia bacterium]
MSLTIRTALPEDAPALAAMNAAFNGDTGVTANDVRRSIAASPEIVVIALMDGAPAGFCCAQVHHSFCYPAPVAEVTEMFVAEPFRRMGCASGMLAWLETHLRAAYGVDEMHLLTGTRNLAAQEAYRKAGFAIRSETFMKKNL